MAQVSMEVTSEVIAILRLSAERLLSEQPEPAAPVTTEEPAWGLAQGLSHVAEQLVAAAVAAGEHVLKYADARYAHGGCPECGSEGRLLHVGRRQYKVCHDHRLAWLIGENLFSGWRDLSPEQHEANRRQVESYTVIDDATPAMLCLACGQSAGHHATWCAHAAEPAAAEPDLDPEIWGDL